MQGRAALVVVTEEHYEQPVEGFTRALAVVADDVADDVSRAAANVLEYPSLPRCARGRGGLVGSFCDNGSGMIIFRFLKQVAAIPLQTCPEQKHSNTNLHIYSLGFPKRSAALSRSPALSTSLQSGCQITIERVC